MKIRDKLSRYVKKHCPYLAQVIYEKKVLHRIKKHKVESNDERKKELARLYKKYIGVDIDWENPKRYTEKIQYRKLFFSGTIYSELSDKYLVRKWVSEKIGEEYLIPLIGVWNSFDEIDFEQMPKEFVLKTNNASGTNVIIRDKKIIDKNLLKRKFDFWMNMDYANFVGYEMHYSLINPKIIAEKLIKNDKKMDLMDYKFMCFNGKVEYIWVDTGRYHDHKRTIFNSQWKREKWQQSYYDVDTSVLKPKNFEKMIEIATILSEGFDHVRVDLYNSEGKIYFGEMTFTNAGGFEKYHPDEMDFRLGELWNIQNCNKKLVDSSETG